MLFRGTRPPIPVVYAMRRFSSQLRLFSSSLAAYLQPADVTGARHNNAYINRYLNVRIVYVASLNGGLGTEPPAGSRGRGRAPGGGSWGAPEAESFLYIFIQKVAKS